MGLRDWKEYQELKAEWIRLGRLEGREEIIREILAHLDERGKDVVYKVACSPAHKTEK